MPNYMARIDHLNADGDPAVAWIDSTCVEGVIARAIDREHETDDEGYEYNERIVAVVSVFVIGDESSYFLFFASLGDAIAAGDAIARRRMESV